MSNQDFDPAASVYVPRVPTKQPTDRYNRVSPTKVSSGADSSYIWNRQELSSPSDADTAQKALQRSEPIETVSSIEQALEERLRAVERSRRSLATETKKPNTESVALPVIEQIESAIHSYIVEENTPTTTQRPPKSSSPRQNRKGVPHQGAPAPEGANERPSLKSKLQPEAPNRPASKPNAGVTKSKMPSTNTINSNTTAPANLPLSDRLLANERVLDASTMVFPTHSRNTVVHVESTSEVEKCHPLTSQPQASQTPPLAQLPMTEVWGLPYHAITMEETLTRIYDIIQRAVPSVAVTSNLNYSMLCDKNPRLRAFTQRAALVLCDGKPIQWRSRLGSTPLPERVAGSDLIYRLAELSQKKGISIYLYGAAEGVAAKAAEDLKKAYPGCIIAGVQCPPFGNNSEEEKERQLDLIRQANPDVLLVALGQPKGEFWIEDNLPKLGVPLAIQVGASFDFVTGNAKRAPKIMQKVGAEWLYRMLHDPKRLAPRYFHNAVYLLKILRRECINALDTKPVKPNAAPRRPLR